MIPLFFSIICKIKIPNILPYFSKKCNKNRASIHGNIAQFTVHALPEYYSGILSPNQRPYVSMRTDYLFNLTKNFTVQSTRLNYAALH